MKRFPLFLAAAALLWMGSSRPAAAQAQVFSDRANWSAAAGSVVSRDFEDLTDGEFVQTVSYDGVTFSSTDNHSQDLVPISPFGSRILASNRNFNPLIATFSPPVKSAGLDVIALQGRPGLIVTVTTGAGSQQIDVALAGEPAFIGFIDESGISSISVANPAGQIDFVCVDNVSYGGSLVTEDPALGSLDHLKAAIEAGMSRGTIKTVGRSLLLHVAVVRAAVIRGKDRAAILVLKAFKLEVRALRTKIAPAKAAELQALADECIVAISL